MKPKIFFNSNLVPAGYDAITLFPFILIKDGPEHTPLDLIVHELTHYLQAKRAFVLPFYLIYLIDYLVNLIIYRSHYVAYLNIPYEIEARNNQELWRRWEDGEVTAENMAQFVDLIFELNQG